MSFSNSGEMKLKMISPAVTSPERGTATWKPDWKNAWEKSIASSRSALIVIPAIPMSALPFSTSPSSSATVLNPTQASFCLNTNGLKGLVATRTYCCGSRLAGVSSGVCAFAVPKAAITEQMSAARSRRAASRAMRQLPVLRGGHYHGATPASVPARGPG